MLGALLVVAAVFMIGGTFVLYQFFGPRKSQLLFTLEEKKQWDSAIPERLAYWFTKSSIFATLTSLATVYVFFVGNTHLLGYWILAAVATLIVGAYVTVWLTNKLTEKGSYADSLQQGNQACAVLSSYFWGASRDEQSMARIVSYVLMAYLLIVLWLEFSVFAKITGELVAPESDLAKFIPMFLIAFFVAYFTFKFGLRGFVYADLFQSPIVILGSLIVFIGGAIIIFSEFDDVSAWLRLLSEQFVSPKLSWKDGMLFALAALFLNAFLVVVTPAHWVRLWIFGKDRLLRQQVDSTRSTAVVWLVLVGVGILASTSMEMVEPEKIAGGETVVVMYLEYLASAAPILVFVFWVSAIAALFSTADSQLYAYMLVKNYRWKDNSLNNKLEISHPFLMASIFALGYSFMFLLAINLDLKLDKLVLVLMPACLTLVPMFYVVHTKRKGKLMVAWFSIVSYLLVAGVGVGSPDASYLVTLGAPLTPLIVFAFSTLLPASNDYSDAVIEEEGV